MIKLKPSLLTGLLSCLVLILSSLGFSHTAKAEGLSFGFGGMAIISPKYEGSKEYKFTGFPLVIPYSTSSSETSTFGSRVSFKGIDDIRLNIWNSETFELGPVAGYRGGRQQSDGVLLGGLGDIDGGLVFGAYGAIDVNGFTLDASYTDQFTGTKSGGKLKLGASTKFELSPRIELTAGVGTTYASDDYMDNFFGVSAAQAASSTATLSAYNPGAGFKDVSFSLGTDTKLNSNWTMKLGGKYSRLIGDAADSPVIETKDQFSGSLGFIYKFGN